LGWSTLISISHKKFSE